MAKLGRLLFLLLLAWLSIAPSALSLPAKQQVVSAIDKGVPSLPWKVQKIFLLSPEVSEIWKIETASLPPLSPIVSDVYIRVRTGQVVKVDVNEAPNNAVARMSVAKIKELLFKPEEDAAIESIVRVPLCLYAKKVSRNSVVVLWP